MGLAPIDEELRRKLIPHGLPEHATQKQARNWLNENLPGLARIFQFFGSIQSESDRGVVICASSFLEDILGQAIRSKLRLISNPTNEMVEAVRQPQPEIVSEKVLDSLLSDRPIPPLGSFAARTKMARALGLINNVMMNALDRIRRMRNDAAHLSEPFQIADDRYDISAVFGPLSHKEQVYLEALRLVGKDDNNPTFSAKRVFTLASSSIYYRLMLIAERPEHYVHLLHSDWGPYDRHYDELMAD